MNGDRPFRGVLRSGRMKVSALVATLGTPAPAGCQAVPLGPGSIQPASDVPVRLDFAGDVIARAAIRVEGSQVFAEFDCPARCRGRWPAIGGVARRRVDGAILDFEVFEVSLCESPNVDPTVPPIRANSRRGSP